jgi:hypothetical protein
MITDLDAIRFLMDGAADPDDEFVARARARLEQAIESTRLTDPEIAVLVHRPKRRKMFWVGIPAVAAVAALVLAVGLLVPGQAQNPPRTGNGVTVLRRAAQLTLDHQAPVIPVGQYLYTEMQSATLMAKNPAGRPTPLNVPPSTEVGQTAPASNPNTPGAGPTYRWFEDLHARSWIDASNMGQASFSWSTSFFSAQDQAEWQSQGSPSIGNKPVSQTTSLSASGFQDLSRLPTDPSALLARFQAGTYGSNDPAAIFATIGQLLEDPEGSSPAVRAALYQVAAMLPGTSNLGTTTDHTGQSGTGVALTEDGIRYILVVDPDNGALLGTEDIVIDPATAADSPIAAARFVPSGTVVQWSTVLVSAPVPLVGALPTLSQTPTSASA